MVFFIFILFVYVQGQLSKDQAEDLISLLGYQIENIPEYDKNITQEQINLAQQISETIQTDKILNIVKEQNRQEIQRRQNEKVMDLIRQAINQQTQDQIVQRAAEAYLAENTLEIILNYSEKKQLRGPQIRLEDAKAQLTDKLLARLQKEVIFSDLVQQGEVVQKAQDVQQENGQVQKIITQEPVEEIQVTQSPQILQNPIEQVVQQTIETIPLQPIEQVPQKTNETIPQQPIEQVSQQPEIMQQQMVEAISQSTPELTIAQQPLQQQVSEETPSLSVVDQIAQPLQPPSLQNLSEQIQEIQMTQNSDALTEAEKIQRQQILEQVQLQVRTYLENMLLFLNQQQEQRQQKLFEIQELLPILNSLG